MFYFVRQFTHLKMNHATCRRDNVCLHFYYTAGEVGHGGGTRTVD